MLRGSFAILLCALVALVGCNTWRQTAIPSLPGRNTIVLDQLLISSDFDLPAHHRLLEEIRTQRVDLSQTLALPVSDEPIHVYLFESGPVFAEFMHSHYPSFPQRRAFFVETDTRLTVYAHWGDRVAEDLRHEVSHGYLHSIIRNLPLWLDEGLAEYFEVPRGTHGLNQPHVDELMAAMAQGNWQPDLQRLEQLGSSAEMTQLDYAEAWAWVHMLLETTPQRRDMLQQHLAGLRKEGIAPPLSIRIRELGIEPQRTLIDYIRLLAARG
jgi:hypothetical protein